MPAPLPVPPPRFLFYHGAGSLTAALGPTTPPPPPGPVATSGPTATPGGPPAPPSTPDPDTVGGPTASTPPSGRTATSGPTAAFGGQTAHRTVAGDLTATPGGPIAQSFTTSSSHASSTSAMSHAAATPSVVLHAAPHDSTHTTHTPQCPRLHPRLAWLRRPSTTHVALGLCESHRHRLYFSSHRR
jgi:hypothetical protein